MEDLSRRYSAPLVPSSMSAGNTTADDRKISMSAPGSPSVLPVADKMDNLPLPQPAGDQFPLGSGDRVNAAHPGHGSGVSWSDTYNTARPWKETG